jgi:hypothetical protein
MTANIVDFDAAKEARVPRGKTLDAHVEGERVWLTTSEGETMILTSAAARTLGFMLMQLADQAEGVEI